jgi:hypothetical protein
MTWAGPGYTKLNDESAPDEPGGEWRQNLAGDPYGAHWRANPVPPYEPDPPPQWSPSHLLPCGCLDNEAGAHRVGCPDHPEGVRGS